MSLFESVIGLAEKVAESVSNYILLTLAVYPTFLFCPLIELD